MTLAEIADLRRALDVADEAAMPFFRNEPAYDPEGEDWIRHEVGKRRAVNACVVVGRKYRDACDEFIRAYMAAEVVP